jgi:hypothetical protein
MEIVTSSGDVVTASRGDTDFDGLVAGLGALGPVTRLTLDVEPASATCSARLPRPSTGTRSSAWTP